VERVEQLAGLTLLPDALKLGARQLCQSTRCELVVRRFDDAQKRAKK
jgi:endonuclease G